MNTKDFLNLFSAESHYFQWFKDNKESETVIHPGGSYSSYDDIASKLTSINEAGGGVYFTVNASNGASRKTADIEEVRALFVDLDDAPLEPALECWPTPSIIVQTSQKKFHCYWLVNDCQLDQFTGIQLLLKDKFNGDPKVHDLPRVMRVPGFYNMKSDPFMIKVIGGNSRVYKTQEVLDGLELENLAAQITEEIEERNGALDVRLEERAAKTGERHGTLLALARKYAGQGYDEAQITRLLYEANTRFMPPIPKKRLQSEVESIVSAVREYEGGVLGSIRLVFDDGKTIEWDADDSAIHLRKRSTMTDELALSAPGFLGELTHLFLQSAIWPQPILALQAAIATMSMIKGKSYQGYFGGWPNVFTVGTAGSATGKGHGLNCIDKIAALTGVDERVVGKCVSGASIATALKRSGGTCISVVDEAGFYFEQLLSDKLQTANSVALRETLMATFNAKRKVRGSEYSSRNGTQERIDSQDPFFSLYGVCTPDTFFKSIRKSHSVDGMLSRILYFRGPDKQMQTKRNWNAAKSSESMSPELEDYLLSLTSVSREFRAGPQPLRYLGGAEKAFIRKVELIDRMIAACHHDPIEQPLRGRMSEYLDKLVNIAADKDVVTVNTIEWAFQCVLACTDDMLHMVQTTCFENEQEAAQSEMHNFISTWETGCSKETITKRFSSLRRVARDETLGTLIESGLVVEVPTHGDTRKTSRVYMTKKNFAEWSSSKFKTLKKGG
jgi:hypothetical protein